MKYALLFCSVLGSIFTHSVSQAQAPGPSPEMPPFKVGDTLENSVTFHETYDRQVIYADGKITGIAGDQLVVAFSTVLIDNGKHGQTHFKKHSIKTLEHAVSEKNACISHGTLYGISAGDTVWWKKYSVDGVTLPLLVKVSSICGDGTYSIEGHTASGKVHAFVKLEEVSK